MLAILAESALRALLLGGVVWIGLISCGYEIRTCT